MGKRAAGAACRLYNRHGRATQQEARDGREDAMIPSIAPDEALVGEPDLRAKPRTDAQRRCRTNSRRGATDPAQRSYPPVQSVCRALDVLRTVNRLRIASVQAIHEATGFPKPTIVRMLETLTAEGYV